MMQSQQSQPKLQQIQQKLQKIQQKQQQIQQKQQQSQLSLKEIFHDINPCIISQSGIFKYILIQLKQKKNPNETLYFIRGNQNLQYHAQNFYDFQDQIKKLGYQIIQQGPYKIIKVDIIGQIYQFKVLGGGRIQHHYNGNKCFIYGYSKSYGHVDHQVAKQIIAKQLGYPLDDVKTSPYGY